ncbi:condensation domain-containing protein [Streptomyces mirabilis]|uniref:Condensation domain-containing protein n=1 Tax=Streptomyces mirabilis TaxID=68239 RepID=A0ABU3UXS7_9ACTN|nr:condensation domain-containing protein [Streptomyces mirabilis]MDU8998719.1 condensation domain-containing protein [Streptomyces mirabilis]
MNSIGNGERHVAPYGIQREMLMFAQRDGEGQPLSHNYLNAFDIYRVTGPLDIARLTRAAERTVGVMDVLGGRFRSEHGVDRFVLEPGAQRLRISHLTVVGTDDLLSSGTWEAMRRIAHSSRDLRHDAPAHLVITALGPEEHLLMPVLDHSYADARTLGLFLRHLAHFYQRPEVSDEELEAVREETSFFAFAENLAERGAERAASRRYWSEALASAADKRLLPQFPGGRWKARGTRQFTAEASEIWPSELILALTDLAKTRRTRLHMVMLALVNLAVSAWGVGFVPINYMRNGRHEATSVGVAGIFAEHVVTVSPQQDSESAGLGDYLAAFAAENSATPQYHGLSLREIETAPSEENRLVLFNFLPPERRIKLGPGTTAAPDQEAFAALEEYDHSNRFGARVWMIANTDYRLKVVAHSDADVLPEPTALVASLHALAEAAIKEQNMPVADAKSLARAAWREAQRKFRTDGDVR